MASRQGFGELKTEQLGGHSQEQQRHRQAPIDDDALNWIIAFLTDSAQVCKTTDGRFSAMHPITRSIIQGYEVELYLRKIRNTSSGYNDKSMFL